MSFNTERILNTAGKLIEDARTYHSDPMEVKIALITAANLVEQEMTAEATKQALFNMLSGK